MCAVLHLQVTLDLQANQPHFIRDIDEGAGLDVEARMQHGSDGFLWHDICGLLSLASHIEMRYSGMHLCLSLDILEMQWSM